MEGRRMCLFRCDSPSCLDSNEIWHADSVCWKMSLFSRRQKNMYKIPLPPPPPPPFLCPYPNNVRFRSLIAKTLCVRLLRYWRGRVKGGWRWTFKNVFEVLFSRLWKKKTQGNFLTWKESARQISADSEQLQKSQRNRYIRLSSMEPFIS